MKKDDAGKSFSSIVVLVLYLIMMTMLIPAGNCLNYALENDNKWYFKGNDTYDIFECATQGLTTELEIKILEDGYFEFYWKKEDDAYSALTYFIDKGQGYERQYPCKEFIRDEKKSIIVGKNYKIKWEFISSVDSGKKAWIIIPLNRKPIVKPQTVYYSNFSRLQPTRPEGPKNGYVGQTYDYSASIGPSTNQIKYKFYWSRSNESNISYTNGCGKISYAWKSPGEYKLMVKAVDDPGNETRWSENLSIIIYRLTDVTNRRGDFESKIENYTELNLIDSEYVLNKIISIKNKEYVTIRSKRDDTNISLMRMYINNSNNILIDNINFVGSRNGIQIKDTSNFILKNSTISFKCCGFGLVIESGEFNRIEDNHILNGSWSCDKTNLSVGIKIKNTKNNYIVNNKIESTNGKSRIRHYVSVGSSGMNNTIIRSAFDPEQEIREDDCVGSWDQNEGFHNCEKLSCIDSNKCDCKIESDAHELNTWRP